VVEDIRKALAIRAMLEKTHHRTAVAVDPTAAVPAITLGAITESEVLSTQAVLSQIPAYRITFTSKAFDGVLFVTRDEAATVIAFNDR
jgi:hypothetical protein